MSSAKQAVPNTVCTLASQKFLSYTSLDIIKELAATTVFAPLIAAEVPVWKVTLCLKWIQNH